MKPLHERYIRGWLNPVDRADTGSVQASVTIDQDKEGQVHHWSQLIICDCARQVVLDFSCSNTKGSIKRRRKKIDMLRKHLDMLEVGLDKLEETLYEYR